MTVSKSPTLEVVKMSVPETVNSGQDVTLSCDYNLGQATLYHIKWYWKGREFYRYEPKMVPNKAHFVLPHFKVDLSKSGPNKVVLLDVTPEQSGPYSCEVSSDAPYFYTFMKSANMKVSKSPILEVVKLSVPQTVKSGQDVTLTCEYNLGQATLYHVRWYWKGQEFYRYEPKMVPNKVHFVLPHFKVDIAHSGPTEVTLKDISAEQSGSYKCEVTTEAPLFKNYQKKATMNVTTN
ncbi:hypothetical protein WA026_003753 [Henosepilachna vigintioctopunctata]|uniref:Ig-like domain-containing protein n=1 Tax=Henosepilachna vigintioctopunctata TaxID=420089 RepID=A0AAW1UDW8_9CUCU